MPVICEWRIQPSKKQWQMDIFLLFLLAVFLLSLASPHWFLLLLIGCFLILLFLWAKDKSITHIGIQKNGLYLIKNKQTLPVQFKVGSIKREKMVRLCWSIWPWHCLVLRPDSFNSYQDFQDFKRCIYSLI